MPALMFDRKILWLMVAIFAVALIGIRLLAGEIARETGWTGTALFVGACLLLAKYLERRDRSRRMY